MVVLVEYGVINGSYAHCTASLTVQIVHLSFYVRKPDILLGLS
jgi:hypothetical protein